MSIKISNEKLHDFILEGWKDGFAKDWGTSRLKTVGASELMDCPRKVANRKQVGDTDFGMNGYAARGDILENNWLAPLFETLFGDAAHGFNQKNQFSLISGRASATPDGLLVKPKLKDLEDFGIDLNDLTDYDKSQKQELNGSLLVELKTHTPRKNAGFGETTAHRYQVLSQLSVAQKASQFDNYPRPKQAILLYCNADDIFDMNAYIIDLDKDFDAESVADHLFDVPWEDHLALGDKLGSCDYCHLKGTPDCEVTDVHLKPSNLFLDQVDEAASLGHQIKGLEERRKEISNTILGKMLEMGAKNSEGEGYKATIVRRTLKPKLKLKEVEPILRQLLAPEKLGSLYGAGSTSQSIRYTKKK